MKTKNYLFHFVSVLFMRCFMANCFDMTVTKNLTTDQSALLVLKAHITSDPHSVLKYNWSISYPVCTWVGITCDARQRRVAALNLSYMDLEGTIPSNLGNLSFLKYLQLRDNNFRGHLPIELGQLHRLRVLDLNNNNLRGGIPTWIGVLSKLQFLQLSNNSLTGTIPDSLFNLTMLEILDLAYNIAEGNISPEIERLYNLRLLYLGNKQLSGSIPSAIFNISTLQMIDLHANSLSGSLPDDLCNHLPKLELLNLNTNKLFGQLLTSFTNCSELRNLSLSYNKFTGRIPENIGNLRKLRYLFLSDNHLEGPIPSSIFNISSSQLIYLANNSLFGSIPVDMCRGIPVIEELSFYGNNISGSIPKNVNNCTLLNNFNLQENRLTGEIPKEIGMLQNLEYLYLGGNSLTGFIPPSIFNISTIVDISMYENDLSGHLPSSMGDTLPNLQQLTLALNKLSGTIPNTISNASKLYLLELGANFFSGNIPNTFGNLRHLLWLNLVENNLTTESSTSEWSFISSLTNCRELIFLGLSSNTLYGILPASIGNFSASIQYLYADGCRLQGTIPTEIGDLTGLILLALSENDLIGTIPKTVGRLWKLQGLYLYYNNLQGPIPNDLCNLQRLDTLHLQSNKLSGKIPTCLESLTSIRQLHLGSNKFTSSIPSSLWTLGYVLNLNLSSNSLSGSLSSDVQNLKVLIDLDLSRNQFSGDIPITLGVLKDLVKLSLAGNKFQGSIPDSLSGLTNIESLDLSNNDLSGKIPISLETLVNLKHFNVSHNRLEGEIPSKGPFRNFSAQSFIWNYALCGSTRLKVPRCKDDNEKGSKKSVIKVLKYVLPPVISITLIVTAIIVFIRCRSRSIKNPPQEDSFHLSAWRGTSYPEIQRATDGLSECNLLGSGSFGSVFKGTLSDGTNVAIKVFNLQLERAFRSFDSECEVLRNIRHRNLLKILSSCCNADFKALILEFMPNGSLEKWLYSHNYFLDILERLNIMIDVASALEYLHHGQSAAVVHCDLKPSNILLDKNMVAHVSDFGISKLLGEGDSMSETLTVATIGYMAPEYGSEGIVSPRSDVYSYGVLLMETFTRKKPTDEMFGGEMNLKNWVKNSLPHGLTQVVDANLLREETASDAKMDCILSVMDLALDCTMDSPEQRISMIDATAKLKRIKMRFVNDGGAMY